MLKYVSLPPHFNRWRIPGIIEKCVSEARKRSGDGIELYSYELRWQDCLNGFYNSKTDEMVLNFNYNVGKNTRALTVRVPVSGNCSGRITWTA